MGVTMRPSSTALAAAGKALLQARDPLVSEWSEMVMRRTAFPPHVTRSNLRRQLTLLIDLLAEMTGPLRRSANEVWLAASEWFGRTAADRGLATGEIVEEFQYVRELLIVHLSELIAALPARQSMATVLRLNRILDDGIAHAVVGYTDALVESMLHQRGSPVSTFPFAESEIEQRLDQFEQELAAIRERGTPVPTATDESAPAWEGIASAEPL
jgi:hypothetical protein